MLAHGTLGLLQPNRNLHKYYLISEPTHRVAAGQPGGRGAAALACEDSGLAGRIVLPSASPLKLPAVPRMAKRVLVCDDHAPTRGLIRTLLESEKSDKFEVVEAATGADCIMAFDSLGPFDLVLL